MNRLLALLCLLAPHLGYGYGYGYGGYDMCARYTYGYGYGYGGTVDPHLNMSLPNWVYMHEGATIPQFGWKQPQHVRCVRKSSRL